MTSLLGRPLSASARPRRGGLAHAAAEDAFMRHPARRADGRPTLAVAVATHGARVLEVRPEALPPAAGVSYHLFLQAVPDTPEVRAHLPRFEERDDVRLHRLDGSGAARSRNAAIERAEADLLLFADDDMTPCPDAYDALRSAFAADGALDFACGRLHGPDGRPYKRYDPPGRRVRFWNCGKVQTPEMALRLRPVRAAGLRFDEAFGAGAANWLGDEYVFLLDALRAGLRGRHLALVLGLHPPDSSGVDASPAAEAVRRAVFRRALGPLGRPAFALLRLKRAVRPPRGRGPVR